MDDPKYDPRTGTYRPCSRCEAVITETLESYERRNDHEHLEDYNDEVWYPWIPD